MDEDWRALLRVALGLDRRPVKEVSASIGAHRSALRAVLSGRRSVSRARLDRWLEQARVPMGVRAGIYAAWVREATHAGDLRETVRRLEAENAALRAAVREGAVADAWRREQERIRDLEHRLLALARLWRAAIPHPELLPDLEERVRGMVSDLRPWAAPGVPPADLPLPGG